MKLRSCALLFVLILSGLHLKAQTSLESFKKSIPLSIDKAFDMGVELIKEAAPQNDYYAAGKIVKEALYLNDSLFEAFATKKEAGELSLTEEVYLKAQQMRYYVSVKADFGKAFSYVVELRRLLENKSDHVLYPIVMADVYHIASWIKHVQHDLAKAKEYGELLLAHAQKYDLADIELRTRMSLAEINQHEGNLEEAFHEFLKLEEQMKGGTDSVLINRLYLLLSNLEMDRKNEQGAVAYAKKAFDIIPASNVQLKSFSTIHLARGYLLNDQADSAIYYGEWAIRIADSLGVQKEQKDLHAFLAEAYKKDGNFELALENLERHLELERDQASLMSAANISNMEADLEAERHDLEVAKKNAEVARKEELVKRQDAELARKQIMNYALIIGLTLTVCLIILAYRSYVVKKRDAAEIQLQKEIVEEKNREITDSISYAKRIQSAILPPPKLVKSYLNSSFILYKPKDIVAGDFYWMEPKGDTILFAAADCTGHGVPGAMVSVVCNNGLNRAVREYGLTDPGKILDKTREIVISEFEKSEEQVKDGMDIALCSLSGAEGKHLLKYAGAHNPLWIIRKGANEVEEVKADKQPIGQYANPLPYTTHELELNEGDSIYIFSDGFADQFGGDKGKKFKTANFKRLLLSFKDEPIEKQKDLIDKAFEDWMGDLEQLDDVCVIGVKI